MPFQNIQVTKLTNYGDAGSPAIAPDGKSVVYVKGDAGDKPSPKHSICLRMIGTTTETQVVPPTEGNFSTAVSTITFLRDGQHIAYGLQLPNQLGATYVVPLSGGNTTKLPLKKAGGINYSPDGQHLAYLNNDLDAGKTNLIVANSDGTNELIIVTRQAPNNVYTFISPSWSPDGKRIACVGQYGTEGFPRVVEVDIAARTERVITSQHWSSIRAVAWLPDGNGLLVTAASEEASAIQQIWHLSYPNGEARRITNGTVSYFGLSLTTDGTSLVTETGSAPTSIWVLPVAAQSPANSNSLRVDMNGGKQINVTNFNGPAFFGFVRLAWTPDGRIVYVSQESGNADIWSMNADGSDRKQLTSDPHSDTWPVVSPDGRSIVFMSDRAGAENIWRMEVDGRNQTRLTSERIERSPVFSPDGRFIFYNSWNSGKASIWKIPLEGGQPTPVTGDLSFQPAVSPDGRLLAYYGSGKILVVPVEGGPPIKTFDQISSKMQWTPDGRALTYLVNRNFVPNLWMQPLDGGEAKQLTTFTTTGYFLLNPSGCASVSQLYCCRKPEPLAVNRSPPAAR